MEYIEVYVECQNCGSLWSTEYNVKKGKRISLTADLERCPLCWFSEE